MGNTQNHLLRGLQANIVRPHARTHCKCIFLELIEKDSRKINSFLKNLLLQENQAISANFDERLKLTSAAEQMQEASKFQPDAVIRKQARERTITCFFLSYQGYKSLRCKHDIFSETNFRGSFRQGLKTAWKNVNDPEPNKWEYKYHHSIHAMLMVANNKLEELINLQQKAEAIIRRHKVFKTLFVEDGKRLFFGDKPVEHFGYVDGLSQPNIWKSPTALDLEFLKQSFVFPDSRGGFGSLLVWKKYEQDVLAFQKKILDLKKRLGISKEKAEAQVIGRFKDGTPLLMSDTPKGTSDPAWLARLKRFDSGEIDYSEDKKGRLCPFASHIRKVNPRTADSLQNQSVHYGPRAFTFKRQIIRRGIPYEDKDGLGLLFMSYQTSIRKQFEFIISSWCNSAGFPNLNYKPRQVGIDPIIGRMVEPDEPLQQRWIGAPRRGNQYLYSFDFTDVITFKGGEYFFAPSLHFFSELDVE